MVAEWDRMEYNGDYEVRGLVNAYHDGLLDEGGLVMLQEELEAYI